RSLHARAVWVRAPPRLPAAESAKTWRGESRTARLQHRRIVHDEYQLAELWRRDHDELSHADGGSGLPQLHVRGSGRRPGNRIHSWNRASPDANHWQLLG